VGKEITANEFDAFRFNLNTLELSWPAGDFAYINLNHAVLIEIRDRKQAPNTTLQR